MHLIAAVVHHSANSMACSMTFVPSFVGPLPPQVPQFNIGFHRTICFSAVPVYKYLQEMQYILKAGYN